jgi:hypothetical protein
MKKLYKVTLKGMTCSTAGSIAYGESYVIAEDETKAYNKVKDFLDENYIGFSYDRALATIEVLAEDDRYTDYGHLLFL